MIAAPLCCCVYHTLGIISTPGPLKYKYPFESFKYKYPFDYSTPRVQVPINGKAASMPAKSSLALYIGKDRQRTPIGLP